MAAKKERCAPPIHAVYAILAKRADPSHHLAGHSLNKESITNRSRDMASASSAIGGTAATGAIGYSRSSVGRTP